MPCPAVTSSSGFLSGALGHLDCQAQTLGSLGFQALGAPGSPVASFLIALLTLFIALFGMRLLFSATVGAQDGINAVLKIGIVLTLAMSWPAYRILAYDSVLKGPAEIAAAITSTEGRDASTGLSERLQQMDDRIVAFTALGTGRQTGSLERPGSTRDSFRHIAVGDETALGWGRTLFLATVVGTFATVRIAGGLLLALAPLFAGLLLFDLTRGLFAGWLRGLALVALGSLGLGILFTVQLVLMEPWLGNILYRRQMGYATPSAPTELMALTLGFTVAAFALLALLARVAFQSDWSIQAWLQSESGRLRHVSDETPWMGARDTAIPHSRALAVRESMLASMSREDANIRSVQPEQVPGNAPGVDHTVRAGGEQALGSSYRRNARRNNASQAQRDLV